MSDPRQAEVREEAAAGLLALAERAAALKRVPRTGWLDRGVTADRVESVADHTAGVALLAWACALERRAAGAALDPDRVVTLALLHDLAEAETGDAPPYDPRAIPGAEDAEARRAFLEQRHIRDEHRTAAKRAAEEAAMRALRDELPATAGAELRALWDELQQGSSAEARFVKEVDRLETFLQSLHYRRADPELPVASFRKEALEAITDPLLAAIRDAALTSEPSARG